MKGWFLGNEYGISMQMELRERGIGGLGPQKEILIFIYLFINIYIYIYIFLYWYKF